MRRAGDDRDLLAGDQFRQHVADRTVGARHKTRRRAVIGIAEIGARARLRRGGDRGDHRVAAIVGERIEQRVERPRLDGARDLDLVADQARQIDVESDRIAVRPRIVERRIVDVGEETDALDAREIGPLRPPARIPEARNHNTAQLDGGVIGRRRSAPSRPQPAVMHRSHRPLRTAVQRPNSCGLPDVAILRCISSRSADDLSRALSRLTGARQKVEITKACRPVPASSFWGVIPSGRNSLGLISGAWLHWGSGTPRRAGRARGL